MNELMAANNSQRQVKTTNLFSMALRRVDTRGDKLISGGELSSITGGSGQNGTSLNKLLCLSSRSSLEC